MRITKISLTAETGIDGYTVEEFQAALKGFVQKGWGEHKLAIDDGCGHWYWIKPKFEVVTASGHTFVEVDISEYEEHEFRDDEVERAQVESEASILDILMAVRKFITPENAALHLYACYDCHRGGGLSVPSRFTTETNEFGVPQIDLSY